jgi:hypothetical protein
MIDFEIQVPFTAMTSMTPRMVLGNYITCDPRLQRFEHDRLMNRCDIEVEPCLDPVRERSCYKIRAHYYDPELELIVRLSL